MTDDGLDLEREVGSLLAAGKLTLAVAESCTGGLVGHRVTSVSGSSAYFMGGIVAYSNEAKMRHLGVRADLLAREGAVSEPVAKQMAVAVKERFGSELGLAVTGIAGPTSGSTRKPVGLVIIALAGRRGCTVREFHFLGNRLEIKSQACQAALELIREQVGTPSS